MRRNQSRLLKTYTVLGIIFTAALGTMLHYTYEWSKQNRIVAFFSPINESTWEHLKLLAVPLLTFSILEYVKIGPMHDNYIIAKALGLLSGMLSILMLFYTYSGVIGINYIVADCFVFYISVLISYLVSASIMHRNIFSSSVFQPIGALLILAVIICFMWFTYFPPKIALFLDPVTHTYGIH